MGFFHHSHINCDVGTLGKGFAFEAQEVEIGDVLLEGSATAAHHLRCQSFKFRQHGAGLEEEHAAVPGEATTGQELFGGCLIGFFHKPGDRQRRHGAGFQRFSRFDIAITGFRSGGHDAESHQSPALRCAATGINGRPEALSVSDDVICRKNEK